MNIINRGEKVPINLKRKYNQTDIKDTLKTDAKHKCMYCEAKPLDTAYGEIEHIKPKSAFHLLIFEWTNLGFVCSKCNNLKSDTYDISCPPIDPYTEDPNDHLVAHGALVLAKPGSDRGIATVALLDLNRLDLTESRNRRVLELNEWIQLLSRLPEGTKKIKFARELEKYIGDDAEFSFIAKDLMEKLGRFLAS